MTSPEFLNWCIAGHIEAHRVQAASLSPEQGFRGLVATEDIPVGSLILRVPEAMLISGRSARNCPALAAALDAHGPLTPVQVRTPAMTSDEAGDISLHRSS